MLKFYDYDGNEMSIENAIHPDLKYIAVESEDDGKFLEKLVDEYLEGHKDYYYYLTSMIGQLKRCIYRRHNGIDYAMDKNIIDEIHHLLYPNIWIYNNVSASWVLSNHIIYDSTKLNAKLKSKSKTENQIQNSDSDSKSEIENEN